MKPRTRRFLSIAAVIVALDQLTKIAVSRGLRAYRDSIDVIDGFFKIVHVQNTGAAGGLLEGFEHRMLVFLAFTLLAVGVLVSLVRELDDDDRPMSVALGLVLGGAIGNAIDRVHKQSVTDFLHFYTDNATIIATLEKVGIPAQYPSFNVADMAIVIGVCVYLGLYLLGRTPQGGPTQGEASP